jgi:hypothetical protein
MTDNKIAKQLYNISESISTYEYPCKVNGKIRMEIEDVIYDFIELGGLNSWKLSEKKYPFFKFDYDEIIKNIKTLEFPSFVFIGTKFYDKITDIFLVLIENYDILKSLEHITCIIFGYCASQQMKITLWIDHLLTYVDTLEHIIKENDYETYKRFIRFWKFYKESRFDNGELKNYFSLRNIRYRNDYFLQFFYQSFNSGKANVKMFALVSIYDSILVCNGKFEKLVFYGVLPTLYGSMAGFLYGLIYGSGDVPPQLLQN